MNIFVDENIPQKIVLRLREEGYSVEYVTRSVDDRDILESAYRKKALLITHDKDFERLVLDERRPTSGVILLRISGRIPIEHRAQIVVNLLRKYGDKLEGACTLLTESYIDIRRPLFCAACQPTFRFHSVTMSGSVFNPPMEIAAPKTRPRSLSSCSSAPTSWPPTIAGESSYRKPCGDTMPVLPPPLVPNEHFQPNPVIAASDL